MADINDIQRAGHSVTSRAWITNPLRRGLLALARPYFVRILAAIGDLERTGVRRDEIERLEQRLQDLGQSSVQIDAFERLKQSSQLASTSALEQRIQLASASATTAQAEVARLNRMLDALRKDQFAVSHRLGSFEDLAQKIEASADVMQVDMTNIHTDLETMRQEHSSIHSLYNELKADIKDTQPLGQVVGIATLPHNLPLAIIGTSLVMHDGPYGRFLLRQPDLISDQILAGAFWDSHLKSVIERTGSVECSAIDAGAYLGFHSAYMSRYFQTVHAFEPQVEIYRMLCANLLLNNCRNVIAANVALYDSAGHMGLADSADQEIPVPGGADGVDYDRIGNAAALAFHAVDAKAKTAVPAQTVDQIGLSNLGFIKVDTQGSDLHVLRGARATIQRCQPVIVTEFERELAKIHDTTLDDYYRFFEEMGYSIEVLDDRGDGKQVDLLATPR